MKLQLYCLNNTPFYALYQEVLKNSVIINNYNNYMDLSVLLAVFT